MRHKWLRMKRTETLDDWLGSACIVAGCWLGMNLRVSNIEEPKSSHCLVPSAWKSKRKSDSLLRHKWLGMKRKETLGDWLGSACIVAGCWLGMNLRVSNIKESKSSQCLVPSAWKSKRKSDSLLRHMWLGMKRKETLGDWLGSACSVAGCWLGMKRKEILDDWLWLGIKRNEVLDDWLGSACIVASCWLE
ncbi:hypothetical protein CARUB_v10022297mg [Capsella rubella]|uniref:Uncharacterized protein n=1 Tax=Capsella rubella TaxID=81985 RepID=R0GGA7_9BRAS|nr:hypothetical protein CARUB_v10022297mg [Capsella rubella]